MPEPVAPAEPEEPAFSVSPEDWESMQQLQGYMMEQLGQIAQALQPQQGLQPPPDSMLSPEEWQYITAMNQQAIQQAVAPLYQMREQYTQDVGSELARDILSDENSRNGDFLFKGSFERALELAEATYLQPAIAQYGENNRAAEQAVAQAAAAVREWETEVGKAYYEREMNQLRGIANAPRQPPAGQNGAVQPHTLPEGNSLRAVARQHFG